MFLISWLLGSIIRKVLTLAIIVLIVAAAGWWFFIREDNKVQKEAAPVTEEIRKAAEATPTAAKATTPAAGATSPTVAAVAATSTFAGKSYRMVEGQSLAWYLAPEKLARLSTSSVAKGTTKDVKGEFHLTADGLDPAKPTTFTVNVATLRSDEGQRDTRVQGALETGKFPTATFTATGVSGLPKEFTETDSVFSVTGSMDLHGVKKDLTWEMKVKKDGEILSILATTNFKFSDFGIKKPDLAGFVTVEESVTIQLQLFATPG